jgi:hypothetical protein
MPSFSHAVTAMNRLGLIIVALTVLTPGALAQQRPMTREMTCREASSLVISRGAVVLGTRPAWVPATDTPQCFVGYTCTDEIPLL